MKKLTAGFLVLAMVLTGCGRQETTGEGVMPTSETRTAMTETVQSTTTAVSTEKRTTTLTTEAETTTSMARETTTVAPEVTTPEENVQETENAVNYNGMQTHEIKGVWLSYLDLQPVFALGTEAAYREAMTEVMTNLKNTGMNTLMYQVRPFGDAVYPSDLFPSTYIVTGIEGGEMPYDPFGIAVEMAHEQGLRIEAWINPYRIRTSGSSVPLLAGGRSETWLNDGSRRVLKTSDGTILYNPASDEARALVVKGVEEILDRYEVDGIHFDDYFYPTTDLAFDEQEYQSFAYDMSHITRDEWRRDNVNTLIAEVYETIHSRNRNIVFGISPQGDIETNYSRLYADVALWMNEEGYLDYMVPQIYFGFDHDSFPYDKVLAQWHGLSEGSHVKVLPGLAAYKIGREDKWAGSGSQEWITKEGILSQMVEEAQIYDAYSGYVLFRYDYIFKPSEEMMSRMTGELQSISQ